MMKTRIEKNGKLWRVSFYYGVQGFTLAYEGTKKEAEWYKERLDACFAAFKAEPIDIDMLNWGELRQKFMEECVDVINNTPKVNLAPYDMFMWFKSRLTENK